MEAYNSHYFLDRTYYGKFSIHINFVPQHTTLPDPFIHSASGSSRCGGDRGAIHEHRPHTPSLHLACSLTQPTAMAMANSEGAAIEDDLTLVRTMKVRNHGPGKVTR